MRHRLEFETRCDRALNLNFKTRLELFPIVLIIPLSLIFASNGSYLQVSFDLVSI